MTNGEYALRVGLFCGGALLLLALLMGVAWVARRRGWIVPRQEPTEYEQKMAELRDAVDKVQAEIGAALEPPLRNLIAYYARGLPKRRRSWSGRHRSE